MKAIINLRTLSAIAALAVSASVSITSYAAADARVINSFNEGSEPHFLQSTAATPEQNAPALVKIEKKASANASKTSSSAYFAKWEAEVTSRGTKDQDAVNVNKVNEGQMPFGQ